jgi:hypothetical protein
MRVYTIEQKQSQTTLQANLKYVAGNGASDELPAVCSWVKTAVIWLYVLSNTVKF